MARITSSAYPRFFLILKKKVKKYIECRNKMRLENRTRLDNQVHQPAGCAKKDAQQPEIARIAFPLVNLLSYGGESHP